MMLKIFSILCLLIIDSKTSEIVTKENKSEDVNFYNSTFETYNSIETVTLRESELNSSLDLQNLEIKEQIKEIKNVSIEKPLNDQTKSREYFKENNCNVNPAILEEIDKYKTDVERITQFILFGDLKGRAYDLLAELTDTFGPRMTGTKELEDSINWILKKSKEEKLENVHSEYFKAPHWVRNKEALHLITPRRQKLSLLGLGSSVGTPKDGIWAEAFVVKSFQQLNDNPIEARGKIVVYNPTWTVYRDMVKYRVHGASRAAKLGAVATLVSSVTPFSIYSPHTGWQVYDEATHKIPTASITKEDAEMLQRFQDRGSALH